MFISPINLSKIAIALFLLTVSYSINAQQALQSSTTVSKNIDFSNNVSLQQTTVSASTVFKTFGDEQSLKSKYAGTPQFEINITSDYKATYGCANTVGTNTYIFTNTAPKTATGENYATDIIVDLGASFNETGFKDKNASLSTALNNSANLTQVRINGYSVYSEMLEYVDGRYRINLKELYDGEMASLYGFFDLDDDGEYDDLPEGASFTITTQTSPKCKVNNQGYNAARILFNNSLGTNLSLETKKTGYNLANIISNETNELITPSTVASGTTFDVAFNAKAMFNPSAYLGGKNQYSELELIFSQKIDFSTIEFSDSYNRELSYAVSTDNKRLTVKIPFLNQETQVLDGFKINGLLLNCFSNSNVSIDWTWRYVCEDCNICKVDWIKRKNSFATTGCVPFDIAVSQEVDEEYPYVDDEVELTIKVENNSAVPAKNIEISSLLPDGYEYISSDTDGEYNKNNGLWKLAELAPKEDETLEIKVKVLPTGNYLNTATLEKYEGGEDSVASNNSSSLETYPVISEIELLQEATFNDENNDSFAQVGETISYTFKVKNTGNFPVKEIVISDAKIAISGSKIVQLDPNQEDSSSFSGVYIITQNDINLGTVYNKAEAVGVDIKGNQVADDTGEITGYEPCQSCAVTHLPQNESMSFIKSYTLEDTNNDGVLGTLNDVITYQFNIKNTGNTTISNITISDPFLHVENLAVSPNILLPNETASLELQYTITQEDVDRGYVENTATLNAQNPITNAVLVTESDSGTSFSGETIENPNDSETPNSDGGSDNNPTNDPTITILKGEIDLSIRKEVNIENPVVGTQVEFTITLKNNGNIPAKDIEVLDELPSGYEYISHTTTAGEYSDITGRWVIDELIVNATAVLKVKVKVLADGDYNNTATITSHQGGNEVGSASVTPLCLTIYNEFSPNGDGRNETFKVDCIQNYANNSLSVMNRWGNAVYERTNYDNSWKGIANRGKSAGKELPSGTYYYVLRLGEGKEDMTGWLYINR